MKYTLKSIVALLLTVSMIAGLLPVDSIRLSVAAAEEIANQQRQQQENADAVLAEASLSFAQIAELARQRIDADTLCDDGEWQYIVLPEYRYAVIVRHMDAQAADVRVPAVLGGADVVALLAGTFDGHERLESVTVTGNVYYADAGAFPRGVTLRGYHGSFAQHWASENRCAFVNLSELDFVAGVVDCSDVDPANFFRYSEKQVALRALEASRLGKGSIFFLPDPANAYAISFYRVVSIGEVEPDGFVIVSCETPDISEVLGSYKVENQIMMPDMNSIQTFGEAAVTQTGRRASGESKETTYSLKFTVPIKLSSSEKIEFSGGYSSQTKFSADYGNLKLNTWKLVNTEKVEFSGKYQGTLEPTPSGKSEISDKDFLKWFTDNNRDKFLSSIQNGERPAGIKRTHFTSNDVPLAKVLLFSLWGIFSAQLTISFKAEFNGSFTISYSTTTETTYYYDNGEMTSKSKEKKSSFDAVVEGEIKVGPNVDVKLYLFAVDFANPSLFIGLEGSGTYDVEKGLEKVSIPTAIQKMNAEDCISIYVHFVVEVAVTVGISKYVEVLSYKKKLTDREILNYHWHFANTKYIVDKMPPDDLLVDAYDEETIMEYALEVPKEDGDYWHPAGTCPMNNCVLLMVPEIDRVNPVGNAPLIKGNQLYRHRALLKNERARVDEWFYDEDLTEPLVSDPEGWPVTIRSGSKIYGRKTDIFVTDIVDYAGKAVHDVHENEAFAALALDECVNTADLNLKNQEHIVGWAYVNSPEDPTPTDGPASIIWSAQTDLEYDERDRTLMALFDNDFSMFFYDLDGQMSKVTTSHYQPVEAPELPVTWNEEVWELTWINVWTNKAVEFPYTADKSSGASLTVRAKLTMKKRVVPEDSTVTMLTAGEFVPAQGKVYAEPRYFNYSTSFQGVTIKGFRSVQSGVDENGLAVEYTVDPEVLSIPAYIDGKPVLGIASGAFDGEETLTGVILPETITSIGDSAFADCPALTMLDLSACSELTSIPDYMADGDGALNSVAINSHVKSIGAYAFRNCMSIETAVINASIGNNAFEGCTGLSSVTLRYQVTSMGQYAFKNCTSITEMTVPFSVEKVGNFFINGCTGLTRLELDGAPAEVTSNMMYVGDDSRLTELVVGNGVTKIGNNAFSNHPNLTTITLPETLMEVGSKALTGTAVAYLKIHDLGVLGTEFARGCETLRELEFEVGTISSYAFAECTNLTRVTLGKHVYGIADHAFNKCTSLTEIAGGGNVLFIGALAMAGCTSLTTFDVGDAVESIEDYAFADCTLLEQINLGQKLVNVGKGAFRRCVSLQALYFPPTVETYGDTLIWGCEGLKTLSVGGPAQPELSGDGTFAVNDNTGVSGTLERIIIHEGVTSLGDDLFSNSYGGRNRYGYGNLKQISLPSTLRSIGANAFALSGAPAVDFPNGSSLETIGAYAFSGNGNLAAFDAGDAVKKIGAGAFDACRSLEQINLGQELVSVGNSAFNKCVSLQALCFPPTVSTYGEKLIWGCEGLKTLSVGGPAQPVLSGDSVFSVNNYTGASGTLETLIINEGVTSIGDDMFSNSYYGRNRYGYTKLKQISLPSTLESIGSYAFFLAGAPSVDFPNGGSLEKIGVYAFGSSRITAFDAGDALKTIEASAFDACTALERINLGQELVSVGSNAFYNCPSLEALYFPPTVETYGTGLIRRCTGLKTLSVGGPAQPELSGEGTFSEHWNVSSTTDSLETLIINEGVTSIGDSVFSNAYSSTSRYGYGNLKQILLPSTLRSVGSYAFAQSGAPAVDFPNGSSLETIGDFAFSGNGRLTDFDAGDALRTIGASAFDACTALKRINLGQELVSVGSNAFYNCPSLEALYFPPTVETYGTGVIRRCTGLKTLSVGGPAQPELSGEGTFSEHWNVSSTTDSLETLIINEGVTSIGDSVFSNAYSSTKRYGYASLRRISLPSTLQSIGDNAFYGAASFEELILPDGIETIAYYAFSGCSKLSLKTGEYNEHVAAYAQAAGIPYAWDFGGMHTLTLLTPDGVLLAEAKLPVGADITQTLEEWKPADADGETFFAWYTHVEKTAIWQGTAMPNFNLTLYAGMTPLHDVAQVLVHEGRELMRSVVQVGEGMDMPWLQEPVLAGYRFGGWFTDAACTQMYTGGGKMPANDITLYGSMVSDITRAIYAAAGDHAVLMKLILQPGDGTEVWLPDTVDGLPLTEIAEGAFDQAGGITVLHLPDGLSAFEPETFAGLTSLNRILTGPQSRSFTARGGALYSRDMTRLVFVPANLSAIAFYVPAGVTAIGANAFAANPWLKAIVLPDSTTTLEDNALYACASLERFTAYGLTDIGENALPTYAANLHVYGPVRTGALRDFLYAGTHNGIDTFISPYNSYTTTLYVDGTARTDIGLEAGTALPYAFLYGEMEDGQIIHTWFTDSALSVVWNPGDLLPAADLNLYASLTPQYAYETAEFEVNGETVSGVRLTAYNGLGGSLVLPRMIDGLPVLAIGEAFLASCHGVVKSVQIGSEVIEIADTALVGPAQYPFGGEVYADADSYAGQWAVRMGYSLAAGVYTLSFESNGGTAIEARMLSAGTAVRLGLPIRDGCAFAGWFMDAALSEVVTLEDGCFIMPGRDVTLYAAWTGEAQEPPFAYEIVAGEVVVTGCGEDMAELTIPEAVNGMPVTAIADGAFMGHASLRSIVLPAAMKSIGSYAFMGSALETAVLGGTQTVGECAFADCAALASVTADEAESLGEQAFARCSALKAFHVGAGLLRMDPSCFTGCTAMRSITADADNPVFSVVNAALVMDGTTLWYYPAGRPDAEYAVPDGVSVIGANAFSGNAYLRRIALPASLQGLGERAFMGCTSLECFALEEDMTVPVIPRQAFSGCASLREVILNHSVSLIDFGAFSGCVSLNEIGIPESVTWIDDFAFSPGGHETLAIRGVYGSEAWRFALANGYRFVSVDTTEATGLTIAMADSMLLGTSAALYATVEPADAVLNGELKWTAGDAGVIYLYDGMAYAVGTGETWLTVTAPNGVSATKWVSVLAPSLRIASYPVYLTVGAVGRITVESTGEALPAYRFAVEDETILSVTEEGELTALSPGTTAVHVLTEQGIQASCVVTVVEIRLSCSALTLVPGQRVRIDVLTEIPGLTEGLAWSCDQESVAAVDGGAITANGAGTAVLRCGLNGQMTVSLTVVDALAAMTLPAALKHVEDEAFYGNSAAESVVLGDRLLSVGSKAMAQMASLKQVALAPAVRSIADDAFEGDGMLTLLCVEGSYGHTYARAHGIPYVVIVK